MVQWPPRERTFMLRELLVAFAVVALCVVMHIAGMASLTTWLLRRRTSLEQNLHILNSSLLLIMVFGIVILLHLSEATIWAALFYSRSLFEDFETSLYFSLKTYTTVGYGDILLPHRWRLLGGIEALSGVLLCGLSTAFIFAILNALFQIRAQSRAEPSAVGLSKLTVTGQDLKS